jgi:hypothetical protein
MVLTALKFTKLILMQQFFRGHPLYATLSSLGNTQKFVKYFVYRADFPL